MKHHNIMLDEHVLELYGDKLVWLPEWKLLCASDIHFEKGSFYSRFGTLLPPYDTEETLMALEKAVMHFRPLIFIALGDSFHDAGAPDRLLPDIRNRLENLIGKVHRWIWITGNHDPEIAHLVQGERHSEMAINGLWFRHQLQKNDNAAEISGHYHPKINIRLREVRISSPCFLRTGNKLIVPAFGSYTGGLNVDADELTKIVTPARREVFAAYQGNIYPL
jgi:DNA ligase-associated metallophosphoesterase